MVEARHALFQAVVPAASPPENRDGGGGFAVSMRQRSKPTSPPAATLEPALIHARDGHGRGALSVEQRQTQSSPAVAGPG